MNAQLLKAAAAAAADLRISRFFTFQKCETERLSIAIKTRKWCQKHPEATPKLEQILQALCD